jgi:hypothetical protein
MGRWTFAVASYTSGFKKFAMSYLPIWGELAAARDDFLEALRIHEQISALIAYDL